MIIKDKISKKDLISGAPEGVFVKLVVDIEKEIMSFGYLYHSYCEVELAREGSERKNLWGANFYPESNGIEFVSLINIKPPANRSMEIENEEIKKTVEAVIRKIIYGA